MILIQELAIDVPWLVHAACPLIEPQARLLNAENLSDSEKKINRSELKSSDYRSN